MAIKFLGDHVAVKKQFLSIAGLAKEDAQREKARCSRAKSFGEKLRRTPGTPKSPVIWLQRWRL